MMETEVFLYSIGKPNRAKNISYSDACSMARMGVIPGVVTGPGGYSLLVAVDRGVEAEAVMKRVAN
ncbi:hypothetical protein [Jiella marina]|uniref:hypothetical protein n=1 Tax=Jiella sp. LLJ827 TaxID=2917712 RepID=UPI0021008751|nr:hypothetical protein [Jiella sp. LLJ827]MCQ0990355.1 hypothetical protein [Jiella sp. LLJ827]